MNDFSKQNIIDAHEYSNNHRKELEHDKVCGCFCCMKIFELSKIEIFLEADNDCDREGTAMCPYCGIDSVIGESSGYPITEEFLTAMNIDLNEMCRPVMQGGVFYKIAFSMLEIPLAPLT